MDESRSGGKLSGPLALKFQQQPPEFPFQHVFFDVKIYLQDMDTGEPKCGVPPVPGNLHRSTCCSQARAWLTDAVTLRRRPAARCATLVRRDTSNGGA